MFFFKEVLIGMCTVKTRVNIHTYTSASLCSKSKRSNKLYLYNNMTIHLWYILSIYLYIYTGPASEYIPINRYVYKLLFLQARRFRERKKERGRK